MTKSKDEKPSLKVSKYLAEKGISPVEKLLELMPDLPPELQAMLWRDILRHVDPPKERPQQPSTAFQQNFVGGQSGNNSIPKVIRVDHDEDELTRLADGRTGETPSDA